MITTATAEHLEGIRALWQQAFGDDSAYADLFLQRRARLSDTPVCLQDGLVCGMLFMLPCRLVFGETAFNCAYLYGVATHEKYRGQGISTRLLQYAYELCRSCGYDVCTLAPATAALFDFYAKRGYGTQGYAKLLTVSAEQLKGIDGGAVTLAATSSAEVVKLRRAAFGDGYLEWDEAAIDYAILENRQTGGSFYGCTTEGERSSLCCLPHGDSLAVKEFSGNTAQLYNVAAGLHQIYGKQKYLFRLSDRGEQGELTPLAMTRWIEKGTDKPFYLSLMLE